MKICLLDSLIYEEKYILSFNDYKNRLEKNKNLIFTVKNDNDEVVAYTSFIPVNYECYLSLKNGAIDKEVITTENIISEDEEKEFYYWESAVVDSSYKNNKLGRRLSEFALYEIISIKTSTINIIAHAVTKAGEKLAKEYGFKPVNFVEENTVIMENIIT